MSPHIFQLNNDCMFEIIGYLPVKDQVNLARSHPKFAAVFSIWSQYNYKFVERKLRSTLSTNEFVDFIRFVGPAVHSLMAPVEIDLLEFVISCCPNIRNLALQLNYRQKLKHMQQVELLLSIPNLKSLTCYAENISQTLCEHLILTLCKLTKLEDLELHSKHYNGNYLYTLKNIKRLRISLNNLTSENLIHCFYSMTNLNWLWLLGGAMYMKTYTFLEMIKCCKNIERLAMNSYDSAELEVAAKLPKLKYLEIYGGTVRCEMFEALADYKSQQLEVLHIPYCCVTAYDALHIAKIRSLKYLGFCSYEEIVFTYLTNLENLEKIFVYNSQLSDETLLNILSSCKKLHNIKIYCCRSITDKFIFEAIEILKNQQPPRKRVDITAVKNNINENVFKNPIYLLNRHLITLKIVSYTLTNDLLYTDIKYD